MRMKKQRWQYLIILGFIAIGFLSAIQNPAINTSSVDFNRLVSWQQIYKVEPSLSECKEGILSDSEKNRVLERVNQIRSLHQLPPVSSQVSIDNIAIEKVALISAANNEDKPNSLSYCVTNPQKELFQKFLGEYTIRYNVVYQATASSTQPIQAVESAYFIDSLLQDTRVKNESYGLFSRELILYPFLTSIAFARADGIPQYRLTEVPDIEGEWQEISINYVANVTLRGTSFKQSVPELQWGAIAYPYLDYPRQFFQKDEFNMGYPRLSFSVIADKNNRNNNSNTNLSRAIVTMTDNQQNPVTISAVKVDESRMGLGHILSWKADGLKPNEYYHVTIANVGVGNSYFNYNYWFRLK